LKNTGKDLPLAYDPSQPTGPYNRVCDHSLAAELLGWRPLVPFAVGLERTIDWYFQTHDASRVSRQLPHALIERTHAPA
jgi:nucleoside-diphosphate-sugar epimerase